MRIARYCWAVAGGHPTLEAWLQDTAASHPWRPFADGSATDPGIANALEMMLYCLEEANPPGLSGKRGAFRDPDLGNVYGVRHELVLGYELLNAGFDIRFGGNAQADIECRDGSSNSIWIEARARAKDDSVLLHDEMKSAHGQHSVLVILTMARTLAISVQERAAICSRVANAIDSMGTGTSTTTVDLPEVGGSAGIDAGSGLGPAVQMNFGPELDEHMKLIEMSIVSLIAEKSAQSRRDGWTRDCLLVIDASRLGMSWLRPEVAWGDRLGAIAIDWANEPFVGVAITFGGLTAPNTYGAFVLSDKYQTANTPLLRSILSSITKQTP